MANWFDREVHAVHSSKVFRFLDRWVLPTVIAVFLRQLVLSAWRLLAAGVASAAVVALVASSSTAPQHTLEMYDTITLATVPANPVAVAGYTSGYWPTYLPLVRAYPRARVISIAINAWHHAECLDVEPGDADPSQVGSWVKADIAAGFRKPCLYFSVSTRGAINYYLAQAGIPRSTVFLWGAHYVYHPGLEGDYDAIQWTDRSHSSNLDESTVTPAFLGIAAGPPAPVPVDHHYGWYPTTTEHLGKHAFNERHIIQVYDAHKKHSKLLRQELLHAAHVVSAAAHADPSSPAGFGVSRPSWNVRHRLFRYHRLHSDALR